MSDSARQPARATFSETERAAWFVAVGCVAAAVHWGVVVGLVSLAGWRPLGANGIAWLVAFNLSFAGHRGLTFRDRGGATTRSAVRFFLVSALGFCLNEAAYAMTLRWSNQRYDLVLAGVLVGVAVITYVLSRHWAFLRNPAR